MHASCRVGLTLKKPKPHAITFLLQPYRFVASLSPPVRDLKKHRALFALHSLRVRPTISATELASVLATDSQSEPAAKAVVNSLTKIRSSFDAVFAKVSAADSKVSAKDGDNSQANICERISEFERTLGVRFEGKELDSESFSQLVALVSAFESTNGLKLSMLRLRC